MMLSMVFLSAALGVGCNSKTKQAQDEIPGPPVAEQLIPAGNGDKQAFRDRAVANPTLTNAEVAPVAPVAKRVLPRPVIPPQTEAETTENAVDAAAEADADASLAKEKVRPEDVPEEGDEILIPPKFLGALIPGANFENVTRDEPINIKALLDQQGIVLTNYQQLIDLGITNYTIARAPKPASEKTTE